MPEQKSKVKARLNQVSIERTKTKETIERKKERQKKKKKLDWNNRN